MLRSLSQTKNQHCRHGSPPRRSTPAGPSPSTDLLQEARHQEKRSFPLGKVLATSFLAVSALSGTAAAAQTTPPAEEISVTEKLCCQDSVDLSKEDPPGEKTRFGLSGSFVNDNMPTFVSRNLGGPEHKTPDGDYFDDDGWTAALRLEANWQKKNSEYVLGGRLMMATERGAWQPGPDFTGKRTDVGELVLQRNQRVELSESTTLDFGLGAGVQAVGQLGGESVQRWWHGTGLLGGRTGQALQGDQMSESFRVRPLLTGGVQVQHQLLEQLSLKSSAQALVPLGHGLGVVGLQAGLQTQLGPLSFEFGGKLDGSWSGADELSFMDVNGVRPGAYGSLSLEAKNLGSLYTRVETGGFRNEPTLTVGLRFGGGSKARLSSFR